MPQAPNPPAVDPLLRLPSTSYHLLRRSAQLVSSTRRNLWIFLTRAADSETVISGSAVLFQLILQVSLPLSGPLSRSRNSPEDLFPCFLTYLHHFRANLCTWTSSVRRHSRKPIYGRYAPARTTTDSTAPTLHLPSSLFFLPLFWVI